MMDLLGYLEFLEIWVPEVFPVPEALRVCQVHLEYLELRVSLGQKEMKGL